MSEEEEKIIERIKKNNPKTRVKNFCFACGFKHKPDYEDCVYNKGY